MGSLQVMISIESSVTRVADSTFLPKCPVSIWLDVAFLVCPLPGLTQSFWPRTPFEVCARPAFSELLQSFLCHGHNMIGIRRFDIQSLGGRHGVRPVRMAALSAAGQHVTQQMQ